MRGPSEPDPALGAAIRTLRVRQGKTQEDLAAAAGIHVTNLSRIERGAIDPLWASVRALSGALGLRPSELSALAEKIEQGDAD